MQDVLVAATPPIVAALLAAAGFWVRRRSHLLTGERAVEEARSRIAVITSILEVYRHDPTRGDEQQRLMKDLDEAYRQLYDVEEAAKRETSVAWVVPLVRGVLLLDRRPSTFTAGVVQVLYYVSLAWLLLWLAAAVLFGLGIAFAETSGSFGTRVATSLGVTVLALVIGLAPALVLYLVVGIFGEAPTRSGRDGPGASLSG